MGTHKTMSSHRYMETALLDLILYIATFLQPHIAQHFAKYPLKSVVAHRTPFRTTRFLYSDITVVTYIERRAIKMT